MTNNQLAAILAERVMGWGVGPDRFMMGGRRWLLRWRFQPLKRLEDAFRLLEALAPQEYSLSKDAEGEYSVRISVGGCTAHGRDKSKPLAICRAVAAARGIEVDL